MDGPASMNAEEFDTFWTFSIVSGGKQGVLNMAFPPRSPIHHFRTRYDETCQSELMLSGNHKCPATHPANDFESARSPKETCRP